MRKIVPLFTRGLTFIWLPATIIVAWMLVSAALVAEVEVASDDHRARPQTVDQDGLDEVLGACRDHRLEGLA